MKDALMGLIRRGRAALSQAVDRVQQKLPPETIAKMLAPVFSVGAGWLTAWAATHLPGLPQFSAGEVAGFFALGTAAMATKLYKLIDGWQKREEARREAAAAALQRASEERVAAIQNAPSDSDTRSAISDLVTTPPPAAAAGRIEVTIQGPTPEAIAAAVSDAMGPKV